MEYEPEGDEDEYDFEEDEFDIDHEILGQLITGAEVRYRDAKEQFNLYRFEAWREYGKVMSGEMLSDSDIKRTLDYMIQARDICYSMHVAQCDLVTLDSLHNMSLGLDVLSEEDAEGYCLSKVIQRYNRIKRPIQRRIQRFDEAIGSLECLSDFKEG